MPADQSIAFCLKTAFPSFINTPEEAGDDVVVAFPTTVQEATHFVNLFNRSRVSCAHK